MLVCGVKMVILSFSRIYSSYLSDVFMYGFGGGIIMCRN